jgi:hypothetical protein
MKYSEILEKYQEAFDNAYYSGQIKGYESSVAFKLGWEAAVDFLTQVRAQEDAGLKQFIAKVAIFSIPLEFKNYKNVLKDIEEYKRDTFLNLLRPGFSIKESLQLLDNVFQLSRVTAASDVSIIESLVKIQKGF